MQMPIFWFLNFFLLCFLIFGFLVQKDDGALSWVQKVDALFLVQKDFALSWIQKVGALFLVQKVDALSWIQKDTDDAFLEGCFFLLVLLVFWFFFGRQLHITRSTRWNPPRTCTKKLDRKCFATTTYRMNRRLPEHMATSKASRIRECSSACWDRESSTSPEGKQTWANLQIIGKSRVCSTSSSQALSLSDRIDTCRAWQRRV